MPHESPAPYSDFETVVHALTPWLEAAALRRLRIFVARDLSDAVHDTVQVAWVSIWRAWGTIEQHDSRRRDNYCMTVLLRKVVDLERAHRRWARLGGAPLALSVEATTTSGEHYTLDVADPRDEVTESEVEADLSLILRRFRMRLATRGDKPWKVHYVRLLQKGTEPIVATRLVRPEMSLTRSGAQVHPKTAAARTAQLRAELAAYLKERRMNEPC